MTRMLVNSECTKSVINHQNNVSVMHIMIMSVKSTDYNSPTPTPSILCCYPALLTYWHTYNAYYDSYYAHV